MMSMKGDGKPVSFIEDCAVPLEHLAEYTDRLTRGVRAARHARHVVRARVGRHAARAADPRHAARRRGEDARDRRGSGGDRARVQGRVLGRARRRARAQRMGRVAVRRRGSTQRVRARSRTLFDPDGLMNPGKIVRAAADGRRDAVPLSARLPTSAARHRARLVGVERAERSADRGDDARRAPAAIRRGGFAKAVEMCNNNGHCRKFDAGTMCPSYRVTRDEQHVTRGRANTLRLALVGPARRRALAVATPCTRRSTCASRARAAGANARPASTWRG